MQKLLFCLISIYVESAVVCKYLHLSCMPSYTVSTILDIYPVHSICLFVFFLLIFLGSTPTSLPITQCPQVMETGSPVGAVVGACIGTALLYTVILLVSIFLWNKKHR